MKKLLNDEELLDNIESTLMHFNELSVMGDTEKELNRAAALLFDCFQEQKQAHGNMVIGGDNQHQHPTREYCDDCAVRDIENKLLKSQRLRNQTGELPINNKTEKTNNEHSV